MAIVIAVRPKLPATPPINEGERQKARAYRAAQNYGMKKVADLVPCLGRVYEHLEQPFMVSFWVALNFQGSSNVGNPVRRLITKLFSDFKRVCEF